MDLVSEYVYDLFSERYNSPNLMFIDWFEDVYLYLDIDIFYLIAELLYESSPSLILSIKLQVL